MSGTHGVPVDGLEEFVGRAVGGERVGSRPKAVEPVLSLLVGLEFAAKVVVCERGVLEIVLSVAAGLPHVEGDVGDGLVGDEIADDTVHVGDLTLMFVLNNRVAELAPGSVRRPERTEDGGGGRLVLGIVGFYVVGNLSDKARMRVSGRSLVFRCQWRTTYDSSPTRSHILCISFRFPFDSAQVLPTWLKNVTPSSHSSGVSSTSRVKSCRCFTADAKISLKRGLVLGPHVSMTFCVKFWSYLWEGAGAPV